MTSASDKKSDKKLLTDNVINFFGKKQEYQSLSNFWEGLVVVNNNEYVSGECCFHGEKFIQLGNLSGSEARRIELLNHGRKFLKESATVPIAGNVAKKMGRSLILTENELAEWTTLSICVQRNICEYKFNNYDEVRSDLRKSGDKILVHPAMRCSEEKVKYKLWEGKGVVIDGNIAILGQNMLGKIWMSMRQRLD